MKAGKFMQRLRGRVQRLRGRLTQDKFDPTGGAEFYELLRTTFEPGAMLLAATNAPARDVTPPMAEAYESTNRKGVMDELEALRRNVRLELNKHEGPNPALLIKYVEKLEFKSPRIVYNLACLYSIAARREAERREEYLDRASEDLRQSISRTPPRERLGLLQRAFADPDLTTLVQARKKEVDDLWKLIPAEARHEADEHPTDVT